MICKSLIVLFQVCSEEYINKLKIVLNEFKNDAFVKNNWHAPVVRTLR